MKLATLKNGTRDGRLVVVSKSLAWCADASHIAPTLQAALDDWHTAAPKLELLAQDLEHEAIPMMRFHERDALSPLPRAYQWVDGSAYVNHVELVRKARGAEMPETFWTDPLVYQGGSDDFTPPRDAIIVPDENFGIDFEGEVAVITGDVPMGTTEADAHRHIKLVMLVNDVSLRNLIPNELGKGFGFYQSKPATTFSPVAVTPDELGDWWNDGKLNRALVSTLNGQPFGKPDAGIDMTFSFAKLIEHVTKTRRLGAGAIVGSGTVSNKEGDSPGRPVSEGGLGYSCIAEIRMIETINSGKPATPFMSFGDTIRIEALDDSGHSIFGAIEQTVQPLTPSALGGQ
ncbi:fumarylacetoacetate hydrolase family protein [Sphingoaurantiacus capsulatus]|uniref:Fumarylacetoacetate hydrolase family protein n=1 Tax=Sphingoaurantiacus capsulatus TaxID=1771310 RepID=A0ABV7X8F9_9SPHN